MKVWNGKNLKVLEERGWIRVFVPYRVLVRHSTLDLLNWLKDEPYEGRYYFSGVKVENNEAGLLYYFEHSVAAQMFVLKWA